MPKNQNFFIFWKIQGGRLTHTIFLVRLKMCQNELLMKNQLVFCFWIDLKSPRINYLTRWSTHLVYFCKTTFFFRQKKAQIWPSRCFLLFSLILSTYDNYMATYEFAEPFLMMTVSRARPNQQNWDDISWLHQQNFLLILVLFSFVFFS